MYGKISSAFLYLLIDKKLFLFYILVCSLISILLPKVKNNDKGLLIKIDSEK